MMAKAYSAGAKRRAKRGRPRDEDAVGREPNGRASRSGREHLPANVVALHARARHTGLNLEMASDQKAATFIGYLSLIGRCDGISEEQYAAADEFLRLRNAYLRAIKAPDAIYDETVTGASGGEVSEAYEDWCRSTRERYGECRKAIQEAQNETRQENLWACLDLCVIQGHHMHHMIGGVRVLCNALSRHFKSGSR